MAMTITEKILAKAANKNSVKPEEIIEIYPDIIMSNDATTHIAIDIFNNQIKSDKLFDVDKCVFVIDHNVPTNDIKTANVHKAMHQFAQKYNITKFHNGDGVCHQILLEKYARPNDIIIGADSHTCTMGAIGAFGTGMGSTDVIAAMTTGKTWLKVPETIKINIEGKFKKGVFARDLILKIIGDLNSDGASYCAIEFSGSSVENMSVSQRAVLCNMAVEAGAKNGIIAADDKTKDFLVQNNRAYDFDSIHSDTDADYKTIFNYNLNDLQPSVTYPHMLDNHHTLEEAEKDKIKIDQGFIGSCNNGRIENLREAAEILKNRKVNRDTKLLISPASREIYLQALNEGLIETFIQSGAIVLNPSCSSCWGGCQGILASGQNGISTGTRNFRGRTGSPDSNVYLASAQTVAASCVSGYIMGAI